MPRARPAGVIANQVFIGCPWRNVRTKYERVIDSLNKKFPLSFIIIGRDENQDAEELLEVIKKKLESSSRAIFDATRGNANVSLEYGFAEAIDIPRAIYLSSHRAARTPGGDRPIISDLAGKRQNHYTQLSGLKNLLTTMARNHAYTKRFDKVFTQQFKRATAGARRRARSLALKVIHAMDGKGSARREDIVQKLLAMNYSRDEVDQAIRRLHTAGLVQSLQGPYSTVSVI